MNARGVLESQVYYRSPSRQRQVTLMLETTTRSSASQRELLVGISDWSQSINDQIRRVSSYPASVLITGPTGSGKEMIARSLHLAGNRHQRPFIPIDCASVTGTLFASQMFGHVKGAFTGANHDALGGFRAADGGTIFLDEIGELELELQAKLLRVLQERLVTPVGSHEGIPVDVRVIAATNRDLPQEVAAGRFREDLFYRLNVISLPTVPLRDRLEDLEPLALHILAKFSIRYGVPLKQLSAAAYDKLVAHDWPGNIRELENVLERSLAFSDSDWIDAESIRFATTASHTPNRAASGGATSATHRTSSSADLASTPSFESQDQARGGHDRSWESLQAIEKRYIIRTLEHAQYNQSAAARLLGIDRNLLIRKVRKYGVDVTRSHRGRPAVAMLTSG